MFDFLRRSGPRSPSLAVRRTLEAGEVPLGTDISTLGMVEQHGRYAGRKVTYFRIFNPSRAASHAADVFIRFTYDDLTAHPHLVLLDGHTESDGIVVLHRGVPDSQRGSALSTGTFCREPANRADHPDDERFVFPPNRLAEAGR